MAVFNDGDEAVGGLHVKVETGSLNGSVLTKGSVGALNVLDTGIEDGLLAGGVGDTSLRWDEGTDGELKAFRHGHFLLDTSVIGNAELLSNGNAWTGDAKEFKAIGAVAEEVVDTVNDEGEGVPVDFGTVGQRDVVSEGKVVIKDVLGGGEAAVDSIDLCLGQAESEDPSLGYAETSKEPRTIERILVGSEGAGDGTGEEGGGVVHGCHDLPLTLLVHVVDGVGEEEGGCCTAGLDHVPGDGPTSEEGSPLTGSGSKDYPILSQAVLIHQEGLVTEGDVGSLLLGLCLNGMLLLLLGPAETSQQQGRNQNTFNRIHERLV